MPLAQSTSVTEAARQVRSGLGGGRLDGYSVVSVSGSDAEEYLHNQTTSDIRSLQLGEGQASALLDRMAHIRSVFSIHRREANTYWLLMETVLVAPTLEHLETYHFTEDVTFTSPAETLQLFTLQGPGSWPFLQQQLPDLTTLPAENAIWAARLFGTFGVTLIRKTLTGEEGYAIAVEATQANAFAKALADALVPFNPVALDAAVLEVLRIEAGVPRFGVDMDHDTLLPETGLERTAVSYTKGCYQGQEIVAKVKTRGSVPKALVGLVFTKDTALPPLGTPLFSGDKTMGTLRSSTYSPMLDASIAMATLGRDWRIPQSVLEVSMVGQMVSATVTFLPFYTSMGIQDRARLAYDTGVQAFAENREEEAIRHLREAIALDPHLADAYEALGVILSRQEEYDEAITLMHRLAELQPEAIMPHTNLSMFYMKKGMKDEAEVEKALATTLEFKKAMVHSQHVKTQAEEQVRQHQALTEKVKMFQEVLALDAEDALACYGLGNVYNQLEQYIDAVPVLEKAVLLDPKYSAAYLALGKALEGAGQTQRAQEIYDEGTKVAAKRGDLMPMQEMQRRLTAMSGE